MSRLGTLYWTCPPCAAERERDRRARHKAAIEAKQAAREAPQMLLRRADDRSAAAGLMLSTTWTCNACRRRHKAEERAEAAQAKAAKKITPEFIEFPPCPKDKRDYWKAWKNIRTLPAIEGEVS